MLLALKKSYIKSGFLDACRMLLLKPISHCYKIWEYFWYLWFWGGGKSRVSCHVFMYYTYIKENRVIIYLYASLTGNVHRVANFCSLFVVGRLLIFLGLHHLSFLHLSKYLGSANWISWEEGEKEAWNLKKPEPDYRAICMSV